MTRKIRHVSMCLLVLTALGLGAAPAHAISWTGLDRGSESMRSPIPGPESNPLVGARREIGVGAGERTAGDSTVGGDAGVPPAVEPVLPGDFGLRVDRFFFWSLLQRFVR